MKFGRYIGKRTHLFRKDLLLELHVLSEGTTGMLTPRIRYLAKKHKSLNEFPYARFDLSGTKTLLHCNNEEWYRYHIKDYIWVKEDEFEFVTSNSEIKSVLTRLDD